jgi:hypothetical protein
MPVSTSDLHPVVQAIAREWQMVVSEGVNPGCKKVSFSHRITRDTQVWELTEAAYALWMQRGRTSGSEIRFVESTGNSRPLFSDGTDETLPASIPVVDLVRAPRGRVHRPLHEDPEYARQLEQITNMFAEGMRASLEPAGAQISNVRVSFDAQLAQPLEYVQTTLFVSGLEPEKPDQKIPDYGRNVDLD